MDSDKPRVEGKDGKLTPSNWRLVIAWLVFQIIMLFLMVVVGVVCNTEIGFFFSPASLKYIGVSGAAFMLTLWIAMQLAHDEKSTHD